MKKKVSVLTCDACEKNSIQADSEMKENDLINLAVKNRDWLVVVGKHHGTITLCSLMCLRKFARTPGNYLKD